jgi:organic radical activating enzyme
LHSGLIIRRYKEAYYEAHGVFPEIRKNGAWLYINDTPMAYRLNQLVEMTIKLKEKEKFKHLIDRASKIAIERKEKKYFEVPKDKEVESIKNLMNAMRETKNNEIEHLKRSIRLKDNQIEQLTKEIERLKENSIFFSMEDL